MRLQETLKQIKAGASERLPAELIQTMGVATRDLQESGLAERALQAGQTAPGFTLEDHLGNPVSSVDLLSGHRLVMTFFRGSW